MEQKDRVKEHPILMSRHTTIAIRDDRKSQTRRVIEPVRGFEHHNICRPDMAADPWAVWWHSAETDRVGVLQNCPYGVPGDRLWVREAFAVISPEPLTEWKLPNAVMVGHNERLLNCWRKRILYRADCDPDIKPEQAGKGTSDNRWRHAMYMPRWASRFLLEITQVRVERLQDISEADAIAEGIERDTSAFLHAGWKLYGQTENMTTSAIESYQSLWNLINGERGLGWECNPWVWSITFQKAGASNHP